VGFEIPAGTSVGRVADHFEKVIPGLGRKPVVVGSFGEEPTDRGRRGSFHAQPAIAPATSTPGASVSDPEEIASAG
jgi:hypothetical protein